MLQQVLQDAIPCVSAAQVPLGEAPTNWPGTWPGPHSLNLGPALIIPGYAAARPMHSAIPLPETIAGAAIDDDIVRDE